jgi:hypothetical protein
LDYRQRKFRLRWGIKLGYQLKSGTLYIVTSDGDACYVPVHALNDDQMPGVNFIGYAVPGHFIVFFQVHQSRERTNVDLVEPLVPVGDAQTVAISYISMVKS